ncbi:MAG: hypothetical protein A3J79_00870, partial [Elusimicrobia bacterium RIFOXYB2_FULL_62_6]
MRRLLLVQLGLLLAFCPGLRAGESAGSAPFNFLFLDGGARAAGMGGAYVSMTGADALLYNPAGIGGLERHELTLMHNQYLQDISQEYAAYASPLGIGLNLNYLDSGKVGRTTISNPGGTGLGDAVLTDMLLTLGLAAKVSGGLTLGVSGKYIKENADGIRTDSRAADIGALYRAPFLPGLTAGAALQNLGPSVKYENASDQLPLSFRLGASYGFKLMELGATVAAELDAERAGETSFAAGIETVSGMLALRFGYNGRNAAGSGITAGAGLRHQDILLDYAFVPFGELGDAHRLSLSFQFGGGETPPAKTVQAKPAKKAEPAPAPPQPEPAAVIIATTAVPAPAVSVSTIVALPASPAPAADYYLEFSPGLLGGTVEAAEPYAVPPSTDGSAGLQARASSYIYEASPDAPVTVENLIITSVVGTGEPVKESIISGSGLLKVCVWTRISSAAVPARVKYVYYLDGKKVRE